MGERRRLVALCSAQRRAGAPKLREPRPTNPEAERTCCRLCAQVEITVVVRRRVVALCSAHDESKVAFFTGCGERWWWCCGMRRTAQKKPLGTADLRVTTGTIDPSDRAKTDV